MTSTPRITALREFLDRSPTPFHAVQEMAGLLEAEGFQRLKEESEWQLKAGSYYVTRNDSSIIAFRLGSQPLASQGIRIVGAHTDSPCIRVKPQPEIRQQGVWQLAVEPYGGVLLNTWFDRDLSLAGRVTGLTVNGELVSRLIDFCRPIVRIPNLAIHLDRSANEERTIQKQKELPPVLALQGTEKSFDFRELLQAELDRNASSGITRVLDYELSLYDTQGAAVNGLHGEFICSARLDNLLSCFTGIQALLAATGEQSAMLVCNDHEEVGSISSCGANGPFLNDVLNRLATQQEHSRVIHRSLFISADNAHAVHPNFPEKHDANHLPKINAGPALKVNSNQRYASNSETSALFRHLCEQSDVPMQSFVARSDMGCGSTIGPITAGVTGLQVVDVGIPQWAMHSIRETAGCADVEAMIKVLTTFYNYSGSLRVRMSP